MNQNEILKFIKQRRWEKFLTRPYAPLFTSMHINVYYKALKELIGVNFKNFIYISKKGNVSIYRDKPNVKKVNDKIYNFLVRNPKKVDQLIKKTKAAEIRIKNIISKEKKAKTNNLESFIENFDLYSGIFVRLTTMPFYLGMVIENRLDPSALRFKEITKKMEKLRAVDYYQDFNRYVLGGYLKKLAKENNLSYDLIWQMIFSEILQLARKKIKPNRKELSQRKKQFVYSFFDNKTNLISSKNFTNKVNKILCKEINKKQKIIQGKIAQPGKTIGEVKIIHNITDIKKFKPGNILVSISTNPELMPALKKAKAIVTDEGGLMCHAAIISRELNIPCIIGTKIATKVLKDGQKVEVDANKGIVRILKK